MGAQGSLALGATKAMMEPEVPEDAPARKAMMGAKENLDLVARLVHRDSMVLQENKAHVASLVPSVLLDQEVLSGQEDTLALLGALAPRENLDLGDLAASKATRATEGIKASMEVAVILV